MRKTLIAGASLLAILVPAAALAAPVAPAWTLYASYGQSNVSGTHLNDWGVGGQGVMPIGSGNWAVQGDLAYNNQSLSGTDIHTTNGVISAFYHDPMGMGRLGAAVGYGSLSLSGASLNTTSYGVFGDWYVRDAATVSARIGGLSTSGSGSSDNRAYAGAQVVAYPMANLALSLTADYYQLGPINHTTGTLKGEWLVSQTTPISVFASVANTEVKASGVSDNISTYSAGLKFYFGGGASLVERQRNGAESWATTPVVEDLF